MEAKDTIELSDINVPSTSDHDIYLDISSSSSSNETEFSTSDLDYAISEPVIPKKPKKPLHTKLYYLSIENFKGLSESTSDTSFKGRIDQLFRTDSQLSMDSEKSYEPLFKRTELYETLTYLTFNLVWMFIAAFVNAILFVLYTYKIVFDSTLYQNKEIFLTNIVCNMIVVVDIAASIIHLVWLKYAVLRDLPPRQKVWITIDIMSIVWLLTYLIPQITRLPSIQLTTITFIVFRLLYRVVSFFYTVSSTPGLGTFKNLLERYGTILFLLVHTFACILRAVSCKKDCENTLDWTSTVEKSVYFGEETPFKWYIVCMYFVLGSINTTGFGNIHVITDLEQIIASILMIIGFMLMVGAFLGSWTTVQVEHYRRHAIYSTRYNLIVRALTHPRISSSLKTKILSYYQTFWEQQKGIRKSDMLEKLPDPLLQQVNLDRYWTAIKKTYLLKNLHPAFQRAIAAVMTTEIYTSGEIIYTQGQLRDTMYYVLRGSVQILSAEDEESPILTLGMGTCLGEISLIYSTKSPVRITASSYTVIQCLKKKDFWKVADDYRKLNQIAKIFAKLEKKMEDAMEAYDLKQFAEERQRNDVPDELALKTVKAKLKTEDPNKISSAYVDSRRKSLEEVPAYSDLYVVSLHQTKLKHSDEICLHTAWPWILQPSSEFIALWEYLIFFTVLVAAVLYPYQIAFNRHFASFTTLILVSVNLIYLMDIVLQTFTAVEDEHGIITKVSDIFKIRCRKMPFLLDVLSFIPFTVMAHMFNITRSDRVLTVLSVNRLFKLHRVVKFLEKLGDSFDVNVAIVRCIEYVVYLLLLSYFMGAVFYMLACFEVECLPNSWFNVIKKQDLEINGNRHKDSFQLSIYFALLVISQTGFGDITPYTMLELVFGMIFFIIGTLVFCYLVADYSAILMLAERTRENYIEMVSVMKKYLKSNNMLLNVQERANAYFALQWRVNKGYVIVNEQSVTFDLAPHLYNEQQISKYMSALVRVPLFQGIDPEIVRMIATKVSRVYFPPYEIVMYARDVVRDMYVIDRGYCEIISAASGKVERIVGPLQHMCDFDMILERPAIHIIRTLTHAQIVTIPYKTIKRIFVTYHLQKELQDLAEDVKASLAVKRLYLNKANVTSIQQKTEEEQTSWFIFPRKKLHFRSIDYERQFDNMGFWKFLKIFLLRRTIMPNGNFIMVWEMFQGIRIFIMAMYYVSLNIAEAYFTYNIFIWGFFDVFAFIDLYVRMHVCYLNERGILVSHPKFTALHYLSGGFIIDVMSLLPTPLILQLMLNAKTTKQRSMMFRVRTVLRLNRLLQIYRIPGAFAFFQQDTLKPKGVILQIFKFLPISIIFFNAFANVLLAITCTMGLDSQGYFTLKLAPNSWIMHSKDQFSFNVTEPINLYITSYYWVAVTALSLGFGDLKAYNVPEMYFIVVLIIAGYLFFTYIFVVISSCKASIDINLTLYQEYMKHLISYMKKEKINRELRKTVIDHFEYIWQRTHGMKAKQILKKLHLTLRQDAVLYLYRHTLAKVPIFIGLNSSFYRLLGMNVQESYFLKGETIIRLNDIIDTFYIIHKGEVTVIAPDGSTYAKLARGCIFGNLDKVGNTRSMISVIAEKGVDLLYLKTELLYTFITDYPVIGNRLQRHILIDNFSYIEKKIAVEQLNAESDEILTLQQTRTMLETVKNVFSFSLHPLTMMIMSFLSCLVVVHHLAFQNHTYLVFLLTYAFDLIHTAKIYLNFHTPFKNDRGEYVTDLYQIRKRYMTPSRFYFELLALLPFEVFAVLAPKKQVLLYLTWLRINRMLRIWNIYHFFDVKFDRLNINVLLVKFGSIIIYVVLMTHIGTCVLYLIACPGNVCRKTSWIYDKAGKMKCNNHYICSLYYMVTITTFTGFGDISPQTIPEILLCIFMILLGKFTMAVFLGDISSIIQNHYYTLVTYDYAMNTMKQYLKTNCITGPLINRVINYVENLWQRDRGLQLPVLLAEAPSYLLEDIKAAAYGKHLFENYIFASCHNDFLRLLIAKLNAHTFFKGDIICHQGDINNTMYFVHKGVINVYDIVGRDEALVDKLKELDCFSLIQGLFANTPHTHTYKAATVSIILTLDLFDWIHLLKYYRATRYQIYDRVHTLKNSNRIKF